MHPITVAITRTVFFGPRGFVSGSTDLIFGTASTTTVLAIPLINIIHSDHYVGGKAQTFPESFDLFAAIKSRKDEYRVSLYCCTAVRLQEEICFGRRSIIYIIRIRYM